MSLLERLEQKAKTPTEINDALSKANPNHGYTGKEVRELDKEFTRLHSEKWVRLEDVQEAVKQATTQIREHIAKRPCYNFHGEHYKDCDCMDCSWKQWCRQLEALIGGQTEQKETTKP